MTDTFPFGPTKEVCHCGKQEGAVSARIYKYSKRVACGANHGKKSRKCNRDCAICVSCRCSKSDSDVLKRQETCPKRRENLGPMSSQHCPRTRTIPANVGIVEVVRLHEGKPSQGDRWDVET